MAKKASIGRIVHYFYNGTVLPAIVTDTYENGNIDATVFRSGAEPTIATRLPHVSHAPAPDVPFWDWPTFVPDEEIPALEPVEAPADGPMEDGESA